MLELGKLRAFHKKKKKKKAQTFNYISSNTIYSWKMILFSSTIWLIICTTSVYGIQSGRLMAPNSIIALSGDVHVQLQLHHNNNFNHYVNKTESNKKKINNLTENVQISNLVISKIIETPKNFSTLHRSEGGGRVGGDRDRDTGGGVDEDNKAWQHVKKLIFKTIAVYPDPRYNVTQVTVPCETFAIAGKYELQFVTNLKTINPPNKNNNNYSGMDTTLMPLHDERLQQTLDVRWPQAEITLSHTRLSTYPETSVKVTLRFPQVNCKNKLPELPEQLAEFFLELLYCGKDSSCSTFVSTNLSKSSIFWSEQIHGFIKQKTFELNCELFGLAGTYAVQLRPKQPDLMLNFPLTRRYINVDWSEKFVFNVFARSIFPCDPHTGIGVLFEYPRCILEQGDRVRVFAKLRADVASLKPPTSLHYVAEQRVIKNQYSLHFSCDLFTEKFVEYCFVYVSQGVSGAVADVRMDCVPTLPVRNSDTGGWGPWSEWTPCSTNCLGGTRNRYRFCDSPPPRYGAKFCEGSSVQTEKCGGKTNSDTWNCIYDNNFAHIDFNNQNKVSQAMGPGCRCGCIVHIGSSKSKRLVAAALQSCPGKSFWLIQADTEKKVSLSFRFLRLPCASQYMKVRDGPSLSSTLIHEVRGNEYVHLPQSIDSTGAQLLIEIYAGDQITSFAKEQNQTNAKDENSNLMTLHCNGGFSLQVQEIFVNKTNAVLATTKQLFRPRDIKRIIRRSGLSIVHISVMIFASIIILISTILGIQFIVRYQKYHLAVAQNCEDGLCLHPPPPGGSSNSLNMLTSRAVSTTTLISEVICLVKMRSKPLVRHSILRESVDVDCMTKSQSAKPKNDKSQADEEAVNTIEIENPQEKELDRDEISSCSKLTLSPMSITEEVSSEQFVVVGVRQKRKIKVCERKTKHEVESSIDSNSMNTPCNSPTTMSPRLTGLRAEFNDRMTVKMLRAHFDELALDSASVASKPSTRPSTASSMTNGQYSPLASCVVSTATVRSTNLKEKKEKQNRKKLLSRPNSDMSIGGNQDTELEMDYYDYDVINAAAAPGSYFSMDPAHLIWIPPFENENNLDMEMNIIMENSTPAESISSIELNKTEQFYKAMKINKYRHFCWPQNNDSDDGSITPTNPTNYTPTSFELLSLQHAAVSPSEANNFKNTLIQQTICAEQLSLNNSKFREHTKSTRSLCNINTNDTLLRQQQHNMLFEDLGKSVRDVTAYRANHHMDGNYMEKETSVVKSQSDLQQYLALDDIQFADDSGSEYENNNCHNNIANA